MPATHSSGRTQPLAQRRARTDRACNFCRIAKQRCEPIEYGATDQPCRRCVTQGLECNLPRATRSQSPSSGLGAQGPGPTRHPIASHSAGGAAEELAFGSETHVQYPQQSESVQVPMIRGSPLGMQPREREGSNPTPQMVPGQIPLQTTGSLPATQGMGPYEQNYPNVAQGSSISESAYLSRGYYEHTTNIPCHPTPCASDGAPNLGYSLHEDTSDSAHEHGPYFGGS